MDTVCTNTFTRARVLLVDSVRYPNVYIIMEMCVLKHMCICASDFVHYLYSDLYSGIAQT